MEMKANEISFNYSRQVAATKLVTHFGHKRGHDGATKHGKWGRQLLKCLPDCLSAWLPSCRAACRPLARVGARCPLAASGHMLDWPASHPSHSCSYYCSCFCSLFFSFSADYCSVQRAWHLNKFSLLPTPDPNPDTPPYFTALHSTPLDLNSTWLDRGVSHYDLRV